MAEIIDKTVPGVSDKVKELIEKAKAETDVKQTTEEEMKDFRDALSVLAPDAEELDPYQMLFEVSTCMQEEFNVLKQMIEKVHGLLLPQMLNAYKAKKNR